MANQLFARKSIETLLEEMRGDNRLHRVLGPISLTSLGVGAIIGAGIFAMTGQVAAQNAGPAVIISYVVAGLACAFAALCYAEIAAMVPVAGSAYTYSYATLGELFAWIIGWDLVLEYAMAGSTVAAAWSGNFRVFLETISGGHVQLPPWLLTDPFTAARDGEWALFNLPAVLVMVLVTAVLVIGIRESANFNNLLVFVKVGVVLFVIAVGLQYVDWTYLHSVPSSDRLLPGQEKIATLAKEEVEKREGLKADELRDRTKQVSAFTVALARVQQARLDSQRLVKAGKISEEDARARVQEATARHQSELPVSENDKAIVESVTTRLEEVSKKREVESWGLLSMLGLNRWLVPIDDAVRSNFMPYGISGMMLGAALVFFAYIGFDSISTHSEEARNPQRDVPLGILASLAICTVFYIVVSAIIVGLVEYPKISLDAAIAEAFGDLARGHKSFWLQMAALLIATGALAGMTSVLLVTYLSQARIFLAMSRDGLLPPKLFAAVHPRFKTPHRSTIVTGVICTVAAAFTPIDDLAQMVNIGTLMAFVMVCAAVLILRKTRPDAQRSFRCPLVWVMAPLGIAFNLGMCLFLQPWTWVRFVGWLAIGLAIYYFYGRRHSVLGQRLQEEIARPGAPETGTRLDEMHES